MKNFQENVLSLSDFSDKCRICLKNYDVMTDIFTSGISDRMMEVINMKITYDDQLPKCMCQYCMKQLEELYKFQCLAKDSDNYLRALLLAEKCFRSENENYEFNKSSKKKSKLRKDYIRKNNCEFIDKMYLIHVTEGTNDSGSQNEICIKDLDGENENGELTNFCRSLIKGKSNDHDYASEQSEKQLFMCLDSSSTENLVLTNSNSGANKLDWFIYQCNKCKECFDSKDFLNEHLTICCNSQISVSLFSYKCPVCSQNINDINLFLDHLKIHKTSFSLSEIEDNNKYISLLESESKISKSVESSVLKNRIFKVNTNYYKCFLCDKLEEADSIKDHLKLCCPDFEEQDYLAHHLRFTCPACQISWIDDFGRFNLHLLSHKEDNVFFVKVNISGESVDLTAEDVMFTPFEKALEILTFAEDECKGSRIVKMRSLFSCQICDFESVSINFLSEHYLEIHDSVRPISCVCPVCCEDFKFFDLSEISKFESHMKNHKEEGVYFLKVNANGTVASDGADNSGLFSDVNDFFIGKVPRPELEFINDISVPVAFMKRTGDGEEVVIAGMKHLKKENKSNGGYICEKCGRKCFGRGNYKRHFLTHVGEEETCAQKRPKCSVCDKTFSNRAVLSEHKRHHLEEEIETVGNSSRTICEVCGKKLSNNASLAKHRRLHANNRENDVLKCRICERSFRRESALNRHLSAHLNPNYFECEECKLPLPSMASLERHKSGHQSSANTHDCKVCKVSFLTKDRLTAHETHTGHHQNRKRFECNVCHERFLTGREFTKHIKLHPKYKMSECALCGKRLSTMQSLMLHLDRHFESNSILCPHCGKQCFEERNYRRHLLTHKGVKPFACDVEGCGKSFYTYFEIKRHKKYHNNTRDFSCPYCPKSFHEANHLKVHIRTHTGERPYTCPHCSKSFVTRTRCKQHINLIHQGVGYDLIQSTISKKVAVFETLETAAC